MRHVLLMVVAIAWPITAVAQDRPIWADMAYFTAPDDASPAPFAGSLTPEATPMILEVTPEDGFIQNPWAWWGLFDFLAETDPVGAVPLFELDAGLFPDLTLTFAQGEAGVVMPVSRDILRRPIAERGPSFWEIVTSDGAAWVVPKTDAEWAGWTRVAFPISLVQSQEGEAWIGMAAVNINGTETSPMRVVLGPVSGGGFIFWDADFDVTAWAEVPVAFAPASPEAPMVASPVSLPSAPIAELGLDLTTLTNGIDPARLLMIGVLSDGTFYHTDVETPFGLHPAPLDMRVGVWSVSKSLIPGIAALRLAEVYGTEFLDRPLVSFFEDENLKYANPEAEARWAAVTLRHALHMKTGMGPDGYDANWAMESANTYEWSYSYDPKDQLARYFAQDPNPNVAGPGERLVYMDQDMWAAALAMDRFLKAERGPGASLLGMLQDEVYGPVGVPEFVAGTTYTADGSPGVPYAAWGALPTPADLARIGLLIANKGVAENGTRILHEGMVEGLFNGDAYSFAFWSDTFATNAELVSAPLMSGAGGNYVSSLPDGRVVVILSKDDYNNDWPDEARQALLSAVADR